MRILTVLQLLGVACATWPAPLGAQSGGGAIRGVIVDDSTRAPLAMVEVYIAAAARFTRTDSSGHFFIGGLPKGNHDLRARRLGYEPLSRSLSVNPADTVEYEWAMVAAPQLVAQVDVRAPATMLGDAERKKHAGLGHYLEREELEKHEDRPLADALRRLTGIRIIRGNRGDVAWVATTRSAMGSTVSSGLTSQDIRDGADQSACYAAIYIGRSPAYTGRAGETLFNVNLIATTLVESVEWYASQSEMPAQYENFGRTCAALVIWTR